jgi:hypothetical protein
MEHIRSCSLTVFIAVFTIMNPIVNIPIFIQLTEGFDEKRKRSIAKTADIAGFVVGTAFVLLGKYIFLICGLTIPAFKVFEGMLIFFIGFQMLLSKTSRFHRHNEPRDYDGVAISPLAISVLASPRNNRYRHEFCFKRRCYSVADNNRDPGSQRVADICGVSLQPPHHQNNWEQKPRSRRQKHGVDPGRTGSNHVDTGNQIGV